MAKAKTAAPLPTLTFHVSRVPAGLAALACLRGMKLSYTATDDAKEPALTLPGETPDAFAGYSEITKRLAPEGLSEADLKVVLEEIIPKLYTGSEDGALARAEVLVEEHSLIPSVNPDTDAAQSSLCASLMLLGSPLLDTAEISKESAVAKLQAAYDSNGALKSGKGQIQVALKKYEREHLPQGGPVLEGAVFGRVCTRFPPEPSGYLHIGHAKAAILNHYFARAYQGRMLFRMDDTNPSKENGDFVANITRDLRTLGLDWDSFSYSSDHFPVVIKYAEDLIHAGKAYCDKTPSEQMQKERFDGVESSYRNATVEENWRLWNEMKNGTEEGQLTCLRAKISMDIPNKCMRDPVIFRVNAKDVHHRTGTQYKVYPTYDFCCPIVDSIEGVTHALRTTEFQDRNDQYNYFCDLLGLPRPRIQEFSRLRLQYSLMSKRHLQWFVDQGVVEGWHDPRFPTVQGLARRGLRIDAIRKFIIEQGASRKVNYQEWSKLWSTNKDFIEPEAKRFFAIHVPVTEELQRQAEEAKARAVQTQSTAEDLPPALVSILDAAGQPKTFSGAKSEVRKVPYHKKNASLGERPVLFSSKVMIDSTDSKDVCALPENAKITLMNWGNFRVVSTASGIVLQELPEDNDFSGTLKLTWLALPEQYLGLQTYEDVLKADSAAAAPSFYRITVKYFGHLVSKAILGPDDDFRNFVNPHSMHITQALVPAAFAEAVHKGDTLQFERWGFYFVDSVDETGHFILHYVPEGKKSGQTGAFEFEN